MAAAAEKFYTWLFGGKSRRRFPPAEFLFLSFLVFVLCMTSPLRAAAMATAAEESWLGAAWLSALALTLPIYRRIYVDPPVAYILIDFLLCISFFCRLKPMGFSSGAIGFRFASSQNTDMIPFRRYKRLFYWLSFFLFFVLFLKDYKWERTHLSVAVCGLAVIEESLEPVCVSFSKLFHMHHRRAKEMAHGELALFLYRWCYPFVSFRHKKRQRKEKSWSLLLAHLPAVYRTLIPTKRRIDRDLYSGLYMCLFINSNQVVSFYPLISLVELATVFFLSPFIFWRAGLCT